MFAIFRVVGFRVLGFVGFEPQCRNLIKKSWPFNPNILGSIFRTLIRTQGFLIRFLHYGIYHYSSTLNPTP